MLWATRLIDTADGIEIERLFAEQAAALGTPTAERSVLLTPGSPVVAPPETAELMLFEAIWLFQLRLWLDLTEAWWAPRSGGVPAR